MQAAPSPSLGSVFVSSDVRVCVNAVGVGRAGQGGEWGTRRWGIWWPRGVGGQVGRGRSVLMTAAAGGVEPCQASSFTQRSRGREGRVTRVVLGSDDRVGQQIYILRQEMKELGRQQ